MKNRRKKSLKERGITLIALVVTIVVLLILAGVTITLMFGENNIFDLAKAVADKTNQAIKDETEGVGKIDSDINKWANGGGSGGGSVENPEDPNPPTTTLPEGWESSKVAKEIKQGDQSAPLPIGFVQSGIAKEQNINTGLVIYQIPDNEKDSIDWSADKEKNGILDVQEKYNQFIWVPVDNPSEMFGTDKDGNSIGKLYNFSTSGITANNWKEDTDNPGKIKWTSNTGYREPDVVTDATGTTGSSYDGDSSNYTNAEIVDKEENPITTAIQFKEQLQEEFEAMRKSVETYGGFYIGRYETGNWHATEENVAKYGTTNAVVVRGCDDISSTSNGTNADSKATWYAYYQKSKAVANETNIKSSMIWGCQWDRTLEWIVDTNRTAEGNKDYTIVTNSWDWGNYTKDKKTTGSSDIYQKNQIYDMAGSVWDWTLETYNSDYRTLRGGSYMSTPTGRPRNCFYSRRRRRLSYTQPFSQWLTCVAMHMTLSIIRST